MKRRSKVGVRPFNDERLTDQLAELVMGWRAAPERYLKPGPGWISRSRFRPLSDIRDAFRVLGVASPEWLLIAKQGRGFTAKICAAGNIGEARGSSEARVITVALARALGLLPGGCVTGASLRKEFPLGANDGA